MKQLLTSLWKWTDSILYPWLHATLNVLLSLIVLLMVSSTAVVAQGVIPTKGTEFWLGANENYPTTPRYFEVYITSDINTSGTISIPLQGWSQPFTVTANLTTTISIPINIVENTTSEIATNKGVHVLANDTISVFAAVIAAYTSDATVVYPKSSIGTHYRISSYQGMESNFLIVATEDSTQVSIVPTATTAGGRPAGVPFIVNLNQGQSYFVKTNSNTSDLTGSTITATSSSGSCRPFAVFSGTRCTNIPISCSACDVLYDQALPVSEWGKTYYAVPFGNTKHTLKIMAEQNGTVCNVNGTALNMSAGQVIEYNNLVGTSCIQSNLPICVTQYIQGGSCNGAGDPAMMYLNSEEQKIDRVTFSTVTSTIITLHRINVIMKTAHIGQLTLDGLSVPASSFTPVAFCNNMSYATLTLSQGSHTLAADSGFTGYAFGSGSYESYAYSVGSFKKNQPIDIDSVLCTTDTVLLGSSQPIFGPWWSTLTNPNDTIGLGSTLMLLPPILPDIYVLHGNEFISGCETIFYFEVSIPSPPQIWVSQVPDSVCVGQLVQLGSGVIPVASNFQYQWTPTTGLNNSNIANPVLTASTSGWYVVAVSSVNSCAPTVFDSVYIDVINGALPTVNAGADQIVCANDTVQLLATGAISYSWNTGALGSTIQFNPTMTTNYIVFGTDVNGCQSSDTVRVTVKPIPNAQAGADRTLCGGISTLLVASGGISYLWSPGNFSGSNFNVTPTTTTNYIVQVTGSNGCKDYDTVMITVSPYAIANAGPDQHICLGDTAVLTASGGIAYFWQPGSSGVNPFLVSPTTSTNYVVMVNNAYNCFARDTVRVIVHPLPAVNAGLNQQICIGDSTQLTVTGGISCTWLPGGDTSRTITVFPTSTMNYLAIVTDSLGCQKADSVNVVVNALPHVNLGADVSICYSDSILLSSPVIGQSYLWSPSGSVTKDITVAPLTNTSYILTLTDFNSCVNSDTIQVIVHAEVIADAGSPSINSCASLSTTLTATGGVSYLWSPGGLTTATIVVSPAFSSSYTVIVSDAFGCTDMDSVQLIINPLITGSSSTSTICLNDSIMLSNSNAVSYLWQPGGSTDSTIAVSPAQPTTYIVYMELSNGCLVYDTTYVNVNPLPLADAGLDQETCIGQNAILNASGGISYWWSNTGSSSASVMVTPVTSDYYVVIVTDGNGCSKMDSVFIEVLPLPIVDAGVDEVICKGDSILLHATGGILYNWFPGALTGASNYFQPLTAVNYVVVVTDSNGCVNSDSVLVIPIEDPEVSFTVSAPFCEMNELNFKNNSSISIGTIVKSEWTFGDGGTSFLIDPIHSYTNPGTYPISLIVESDNGCIDSLFTSIYINVKPIIDFTLSNECVNEDVQFANHSTISIGTINTWSWNFGDGNYASEQHPMHAYTAEGSYVIQLTAISDSGCINSKSINNAIQIYPLPIANFSATPFEASIFTPQIQFNDESFGSIKWNWNFADGTGMSIVSNPYYVYSDTGRFNVELIVTSVHGCLDTMYKEIYIKPGLSVYIPNAFTPNDDGNNDYFYPSGIGYLGMELFIFNRWGEQIFSTNDKTKGWDGKSKNGNEPCMDGVYIYIVKVVDYENTPHEYNGTVSLYR
jgi:gliding motility-associated-like protein